MALEEDKEIFNVFFGSTRKTILTMVTTKSLLTVVASQDLDAITIVPWKFAQK